MEFWFIKKNSLWIACLIAATFMLPACSNTIDPIDEETGIYGIYGVLNLNNELNYIRVKDLNVPFTKEATESIDVTVTLENLANGTSSQLNRSSIIELEGVFLHNFITEQNILPSTNYRLTAERSDGVIVSINTTTPNRPAPRAFPTNQNCFTPITFEISPNNGGVVDLAVGFKYRASPDTIDFAPNTVVEPDLADEKISHTFDPNFILNLNQVSFDDFHCYEDLAVDSTYIRYTHYGPGFYEKIVNDPFDILASTDRLGSLYIDTLAIPIDTSRVCPQEC